jgi:hypothetical protein
LVPADLETVCLRCLEKDPSRRYPTADALADDLGRWLAGRPVVARPVGPVGKAWKWARRNPVVAGLLVALGAAIGGGVGGIYAKYLDAVRAREGADRARAAAQDEAAAKTRALEQLTNEQAAKELAFVSGLIPPLEDSGRRSGEKVTPVQYASLRTLADTQEERVRLRILDAGLQAPGGAAILVRWRTELVHASVGLNPEAAARLRERLRARFEGETPDPAGLAACAMWVAELPPADDGLDRLAAAALISYVVNNPPSTWGVEIRVGWRVAHPARRLLTPPAAVPLLSRSEADDRAEAMDHLALGLSTLLARLAPGDAADVTGPHARALASRMGDETDLWRQMNLAKGLAGLARGLAPADARALVEDLTGQMVTRKYRESKVAWGSLLAALAGRLDAGEARALAAALDARMATEPDTRTLGVLAEGVSALAGQLGPADALPLAKALVDRMAVVSEGDVLSHLAGGFLAVQARLPAGEVAPLAGTAARALVAGLSKEPGNLMSIELRRVYDRYLVALAGRLGPAAAAPLANALVEAALSDRRGYLLRDAASSLSALAAQLAPSDAAAITGTLVGRLSSESDRFKLEALVEVLPSFAARIDARSAAPLAEALVERLVAEKELEAQEQLSLALSSLATRLAPADAAPLARSLAGRLREERKSFRTADLAVGLSALAGQLSPEEAAAVSGPPAKVLADRMKADEYGNSVGDLAVGVSALTSRLRPDDVSAIARAAATALVTHVGKVRRGPGRENLAYQIALLARWLTPEEAEPLATALANRVVSDHNTDSLDLALALAAVLGRLNPSRAAVVARPAVGGFAGRLHTARQEESFEDLWAGLEPLAPLLADADLLALYKSHGMFGHVRVATLTEVGRRSCRTQTSAALAVAGAAPISVAPSPPFADIWEFAAWAEKLRPDLDLRSRPRWPARN